MPRQSSIEKRTRRQIDSREFYSWTTPKLDDSARPVDAYVRPKEAYRVPPSGTLTAFQQSLENLLGAVKGGARLMQQQQEEEKKAGQAAAARKEEAPEDASQAFLYGHELIKGKAAAADLATLLNQHFEENKDATPEEYLGGMDAKIKQFMAGRSKPFVEGILPDAVNIEQTYKQKFVQYQTAKIQEEGLANLGKAFSVDFKAISALPPEERAKTLRELVDGAIVLGKTTYGLSAKQVGEHLVDIIGREAVQNGDPSLLEYATIEGKDGIRPADNPVLAKKLYAYRTAAESEARRVEHEAKAHQQKLLKDAEDMIENRIISVLMDPTKPVDEARALLEQYSDPTKNKFGIVLSPARVGAYHKAIAERSQGFAKTTDFDLFVQAKTQAAKGELSLEEFQALKPYLEEHDARDLLNIMTRGGTAKVRSKSEVNYYKQVSAAMRTVSGAEALMSGKFDGNGNRRAELVQQLSIDWWENYKDKNGGKEPSLAEQVEALEQFKAKAYQVAPPMIQMFGETTSQPQPAQVPTPQQPKPAAAAPKSQQSGPQTQKTQDLDLQEKFNKLKSK